MNVSLIGDIPDDHHFALGHSPARITITLE